MTKRSLGKNTLLNLVKTMGTYIFPLITYPYVFRVLRADGVGKYNYVYSIISYFILIACLGTNTYAIRECAKIRDSKEKTNLFASEIIGISTISTLCAYILLFGLIFLLPVLQNYKFLFFVLSPVIIATAFNLEWVLIVYEDFLFVTVRTFIINVIALFLVFILVHKEEDIYIYAAIHTVQLLAIMVLNVYYSKRYIKYAFSLNIRRHIKPILLLFSMSIAIQIYVNVDTTMLGYFVGDRSVGLYNAANKVYSVIKTGVVAIITTFTPRLTSYIGNSNINYSIDKYKHYLGTLLKIILLVTFPIVAGVCVFSKNIILILSGNDYLESRYALIILAFAIPVCCISTYINTCILILNNDEKKTLIATVIGAIFNFILNLYFIPNYQQNGAALTTLFSEILVLAIVIVFSTKYYDYLNFSTIKKDILKSIIGSLIVIICFAIMNKIIISSFLVLLLTFVASLIVYGIFLYIVGDDLILSFFHVKGV